MRERGVDFRRRSDFEPIRGFGEKPSDGIRRTGGMQLAMYGVGNENALEQLRQQVCSSMRMR
jgi:hypothetical protein